MEEAPKRMKDEKVVLKIVAGERNRLSITNSCLKMQKPLKQQK